MLNILSWLILCLCITVMSLLFKFYRVYNGHFHTSKFYAFDLISQNDHKMVWHIEMFCGKSKSTFHRTYKFITCAYSQSLQRDVKQSTWHCVTQNRKGCWRRNSKTQTFFCVSNLLSEKDFQVMCNGIMILNKKTDRSIRYNYINVMLRAIPCSLRCCKVWNNRSNGPNEIQVS